MDEIWIFWMIFIKWCIFYSPLHNRCCMARLPVIQTWPSLTWKSSVNLGDHWTMFWPQWTVLLPVPTYNPSSNTESIYQCIVGTFLYCISLFKLILQKEPIKKHTFHISIGLYVPVAITVPNTWEATVTLWLDVWPLHPWISGKPWFTIKPLWGLQWLVFLVKL